jgi:hypothetical protein
MYRDLPSQNVAQNTREIPKEMLFRISEARQDTIKRNRWWFKLPEEWVNRAFKDKVLGLRSIRLIPRWFAPHFSWSIYYYSGRSMKIDPLHIYTVTIDDLFIGVGTTIRYIEDYFNKIYDTFIELFNIQTQHPDPEGSITKEHNYMKYCNYRYAPSLENASKILCGFEFESVIGYNPGEEGFSALLFDNPNQDAIDLFGEDLFKPRLIPENRAVTVIWDRRELYILSSLAISSDKNGYLGHSRSADYIPIKYYRLDSDDKEFWIELYSEREHRCSADDLQKVSDLYLEMIFMFNTHAML